MGSAASEVPRAVECDVAAGRNCKLEGGMLACRTMIP